MKKTKLFTALFAAMWLTLCFAGCAADSKSDTESEITRIEITDAPEAAATIQEIAESVHFIVYYENQDKRTYTFAQLQKLIDGIKGTVRINDAELPGMTEPFNSLWETVTFSIECNGTTYRSAPVRNKNYNSTDTDEITGIRISYIGEAGGVQDVLSGAVITLVRGESEDECLYAELPDGIKTALSFTADGTSASEQYTFPAEKETVTLVIAYGELSASVTVKNKNHASEQTYTYTVAQKAEKLAEIYGIDLADADSTAELPLTAQAIRLLGNLVAFSDQKIDALEQQPDVILNADLLAAYRDGTVSITKSEGVYTLPELTNKDTNVEDYKIYDKKIDQYTVKTSDNIVLKDEFDYFEMVVNKMRYLVNTKFLQV